MSGVLLAVVSRSSACCLTYAEHAMILARETALVIWDKEKGVEHFIRKAEFEGNARDFGFIFPSPTEPFRLAVANSEVFGRLDHHYSPEMYKSAESDDVEILQKKKLGDFDATVIRAKDGKAMSRWLKKQGHRLRPSMTPWFEHYAKKGWVFTALKYQGRRDFTPTKALCISFKAKVPFYPFKMPTDTWPKGHHRELDLFVLSDAEVRGSYTSGKDWETKKKWSATLAASDRGFLERDLLVNDKPLQLPRNLVLTRFVNAVEATDYGHDLVFQSVQAPQRKGSRSANPQGGRGGTLPPLLWLGALIGTGCSVVAWAIWRKPSRR
ncbi:MAG: DUF2330 domain-containing protein [Fimbriimonadaceae bacterium]|nr:DUF2330 domain-containing protein [Fimbriimonadaceae bacterium]